MRTEVVLPKWGMTMQQGTIVSWLVARGDAVEEGTPIAIVETEKVEAEVESPAAGILTEIFVQADETVDVGTIIAYIDS